MKPSTKSCPHQPYQSEVSEVRLHVLPISSIGTSKSASKYLWALSAPSSTGRVADFPHKPLQVSVRISPGQLCVEINTHAIAFRQYLPTQLLARLSLVVEISCRSKAYTDAVRVPVPRHAILSSPGQTARPQWVPCQVSPSQRNALPRRSPFSTSGSSRRLSTRFAGAWSMMAKG